MKRTDVLKVLLGGAQIGILLSAAVPFINMALLKIPTEFGIGFVFFGSIVLICLLCGTAVIGRNGRESVFKLISGIAVLFLSNTVLSRLDVLLKMYRQHTGSNKVSYQDAFIWGPFLIFLCVGALIPLTVGLCLSMTKKKSDKFMGTVLILQRFVISFICLGLIIAVITVIIALPDASASYGG